MQYWINFSPYIGCTVLVVNSRMVNPAKTLTVSRNYAVIQYDLCRRVQNVPYARLIPVLDHEIPHGKRRKCDQFHYVPHHDSLQQEYGHNEPVHKQSSRECSSTILKSLSLHRRFLLKSCQRPLTQQRTTKGFNDEVVSDDYHVYHEKWLAMRCSRRGLVTRTSGDGVNTSILSEIPYDHPHCFLPPGEWTNLVKVTKLMKDFALACIPKTNFPGVDVCLFDLCTCLDYGVEMDI